MDLILTDTSGNEVRAILDAELDMDLGTTNDFVLSVSRVGYPDDITNMCRIFKPGSEFGGLIRRKGTRTVDNTATFGGYTWRGLLQHKVIQPPSGYDYATATGELNAILWGMVEPEFGGLFVASTVDTGVTVSGYQFERYCTLHDGLQKMLKSVGYKLHLEYIQGTNGSAGYVEISAVPIVDYSSTIELSGDMQFNFAAEAINDGVNHLICLGEGELKDRVVEHLYVQADGTISTSSQYYTGEDEIADVYDFPGADSATLIEYAEQAIVPLQNSVNFSMKIETLDFDVEIGDIVGGRDYITGITMAKPIVGKVWTVKRNGSEKVEYKIEGED